MSNEDKYLKLDWIDTKESARNFAELIVRGRRQTIFLDGKWGSGKTEYLKNVKASAKGKNFAEVNLWKVTNNNTVASIIVKTLLPRWFKWLSIVGYIFIIVFILLTPQINLGIEAFLLLLTGTRIIAFVKFVAGIVALPVAVFKFLTLRNEDIWLYLVEKIPFKNRVLIFDDFDRVDEDRQKEAYKLFNILHEKMTIIFVGDYQKIANNEDNFLQKIIDTKMKLPYVLQANEIAKGLRKKLEKLVEDIRDVEDNKLLSQGLSTLIGLFVIEDRTLREVHQFLNVSYKEFFYFSKVWSVHPIQQLSLIYIYLFYPTYYAKLQHGWVPVQSLDAEDVYHMNENDVDHIMDDYNAQTEDDKEFSDKFYEILNFHSTYFKPFQNNKEAYWINEVTPNMSIQDIISVLHDPHQIFEYIKDDNPNDIKDWFWRNEFKPIYKGRYKENFRTAVYRFVQEGYWKSDKIDVVYTVLRKECESLNDDDKILEKFAPLWQGKSLDLKLDFFHSYLVPRKWDVMSPKINKYFQEEIDQFIQSSEFVQSDRPHYVLCFAMLDINNSQWDKVIFNLDDDEYLRFLGFWNITTDYYHSNNPTEWMYFDKISDERRRNKFKQRYEEIKASESNINEQANEEPVTI